MVEKVVKVTNKGMISIPAEIRKKHKIFDGDFIVIKENEDGTLKIIPIKSIESLREQALTIEEFREVLKKSLQEDKELER